MFRGSANSCAQKSQVPLRCRIAMSQRRENSTDRSAQGESSVERRSRLGRSCVSTPPKAIGLCLVDDSGSLGPRQQISVVVEQVVRIREVEARGSANQLQALEALACVRHDAPILTLQPDLTR